MEEILHQFIPLFIGFHTSKVVQDFSHQQYHLQINHPSMSAVTPKPQEAGAILLLQEATRGDFSLRRVWMVVQKYSEHPPKMYNTIIESIVASN